MRRIASVFILLCSLASVRLVAFTWDPVAADGEAAMYRTHVIDPAIGLVPQDIREGIFTEPEAWLGKLVAFLASDAESDYRVVKRIHDWIADSISYSLFADIAVNRFLRTRITNCTGYSELFRRMAGLAGIGSIVVFGYSRTYEFADGSQGNHAWNIVTINGREYLLDVTHDARMRARGDSLGEKKPYSDDEFLMRPEIKILHNMPYDPKHQLLAKPWTYEEYMGKPRTRVSFTRYGLEFDGTGFDTEVVEAKYNWGGGGSSIAGTFDGIKTNGAAHTLAIECPADVELTMRVGNPGFEGDGRIAVKRSGTRVLISFSASEKGSLMATVSARYAGSDAWEGVYSFMLMEERGAGPRVGG